MTNWNTAGWDVDNTTYANAGQGMVVSIIDTGMNYSVDSQGNIVYHPDLNDSLQLGGMRGFKYNGQGVDVYYRPTDPDQRPYIQDLYPPPVGGHGTWVAGVIAAAINGMGIIGAAPKVTIYSLKLNSILINDGGHAKEEEEAAAINYSVDYLHARVVEISILGPENNTDLQTAVNYAYFDWQYSRQGPLVIVAAGNDNKTVNGYPALCDNVLVVGATDQNDTKASFSNFGSQIFCVAPGVDINTTDGYDGTYIIQNGTSFAVPLVAAAAAMVSASKLDTIFGPAWYNAAVTNKLKYNGTLPLGGGWNNYTGYGLINAWLANQRPIGDVNQDNKTDGKDLGLVAYAYGSYPESPTWDPRADININKKVEGKDLGIVAYYFGAGDP
jgi:hypothetical protein